eukprot:scaffold4001_cov67-Attheya_sp.AAC.6
MEQMPHNLYQYSIPAQSPPRMQPRVYICCNLRDLWSSQWSWCNRWWERRAKKLDVECDQLSHELALLAKNIRAP